MKLLAFILLALGSTFSLHAQHEGLAHSDLKVSAFLPKHLNQWEQVKDLTLSPDKQEIYFTAVDDTTGQPCIWTMRRLGHIWTRPKPASFASEYPEQTPHLSPDGQRLYYASTRPSSRDELGGNYDIWMVERDGEQWSEPKPLPAIVNSAADELYPCVTAEGHIYFSVQNENTFSLRRSAWQRGVYHAPELLPSVAGQPVVGWQAYVAPDESFLIFACQESGDLFYCFKQPDQKWSEAIRFSAPVNAVALDHAPTVDLERQHMYFTRSEEGSSRIFQTNFSYLLEILR